MATDFERVVNTTWTLAEKGFQDETIKHRPFLGMLEAKGKIKANLDGRTPSWGVKFKNLALSPYVDAGQLAWVRSQSFKRPELTWRGYTMTDIIPIMEQLQNKGERALIKVFEDRAEDMTRDFKNVFPKELLQTDGNATGSEDKFHGLPSIFGDDGGIVDGDEIGDNTDTYAGLNTLKGSYGGASGDPHYDFWSPVLINSGYNGGSWTTKADERLRKGIQECSYGNNAEDTPDLVLCTKADYTLLLNLIDDREQIFNKRGEDSLAVKVGFQRVLSFDGVDVTWDADVPTTSGGFTLNAYILNFNFLELWLLHEFLVKTGSQFDPDQLSFKFWLAIFGNLIIRSPRHQGVVKAYA